MTTKRELKSVKELVEHILENNPRTRNSDTALYLDACRYLGAETLEDLERINLNIISVHKARQVIQNKEGKFLPDEAVGEERKRRRWEVKDYMIQQGD